MAILRKGLYKGYILTNRYEDETHTRTQTIKNILHNIINVVNLRAHVSATPMAILREGLYKGYTIQSSRTKTKT